MNSEITSASGIRVRGVTKRFGSVTALAGVDLDVAPGEIVALLGPNGAGKSTLLRIISGLVIPDDGAVSVCGVDARSAPNKAKGKLGVMIGDERSHYWRLTGRQNLEFFAALYGLRRRAAAIQTQQLLTRLGLEDAADRPVRNYSSGMRMRLALARALLPDPPILLLDEPTRSLDPLAATSFRDMTVALVRNARAGILLATHDLHEAAALADRVVVLASGSVALSAHVAEMSASELEKAFVAAVAVGSPMAIQGTA